MRKRLVARALASALTSGDGDVDVMVASGAAVLGRRYRWLRPLARRVAQRFFGLRPRPRGAAVIAFLLHDEGFQRGYAKDQPQAHAWLQSATMAPVDKASSWPLPAVCTTGELLAWLELEPTQLEWLTDWHGQAERVGKPRFEHYHHRFLPKKKSSAPPRLIESPKPRLKAIQRRLLRELLDLIPPHEAAHGFRPGRSVRSFVAPHVGQACVLRLDLQDFFVSIRRPAVHAIFRTAGYPDAVATRLAGLCTHATPERVWGTVDPGAGDHCQHIAARRRYAQPHLPQGAPTSPALANLRAYRLDARLSGLARVAHARYTRYADDLAFSGARDFARQAEGFRDRVAAIVMDQGFAVHFRKTRIMRRSVRQHLAGVVLNERMNLRRSDYDRLKATLTNCVRHGGLSQNRSGHPSFREHLLGRISHTQSLNSARGSRLRELFDRIEW